MKYKISAFLLVTYLLIDTGISQTTWQRAADLNIPRGGASAVSWNNYIYLFGGISNNNNVLNSVERYDLNTAVWDTIHVPDFETPRYNTSAVVFEDKIYLIGGRDQETVFDEVEIYDPVLNIWSDVQKLRNDREGLASAVFNDRIYVVGGQTENYTLVDEIEWYDLPGNDWLEAIFNLPFPRSAHFSGVVQDTFYMFGGFYYGLTSTSYRAVPGDSGYSWIQGDNLITGRAYGASAQNDTAIFLMGGITAAGKSDIVEIYSIQSRGITSGPDLTQSRSGAAGAASGDKIFIIGGFTGASNDVISTVEYLGTPTSMVREQHTAALSPGSEILIKGYPNPFNGNITFNIRIPDPGQYTFRIFDITGREVIKLGNGWVSNGERVLNWNATGTDGSVVASGIYFLVVSSPALHQKFKIVYVK